MLQFFFFFFLQNCIYFFFNYQSVIIFIDAYSHSFLRESNQTELSSENKKIINYYYLNL